MASGVILTSHLWIAAKEGIEKNMQTTLMGYIRLRFRRGGREHGNFSIVWGKGYIP